MTYDSEVENAFFVHLPNGNKCQFGEGQEDIYYMTVPGEDSVEVVPKEDDVKTANFPQTVEGNA